MIEETRDTDLLSAFFRDDPALYAYQLGDLDPLFFPATRWWITRRDEVTSSLLLYTAFETAVIQAITDNDDRGRGYCTAVTKALVNLLAPDVETIALNVSCQNTTAIGIYERLGFQRRHSYISYQ